MKKISVSLVVYNEGKTLKETIINGYNDLKKIYSNFEMWIFDNKSTDNTQEIVTKLQQERANLFYFQQPINVGYAYSTLTTFKIPQADIYVTVDGDGQYKLTDVKLLTDELDNGADIVFANRKQRNDPFSRVVMSSVFNIIARNILGKEVIDLNCGFRAMNKKSAKNINVIYRKNYVGPEIFTRAKQLELNIRNMNVKHFNRRAGQSVYNSLGKTFNYVIDMLSYILRLKKELKNTPPVKSRYEPLKFMNHNIGNNNNHISFDIAESNIANSLEENVLQ